MVAIAVFQNIFVRRDPPKKAILYNKLAYINIIIKKLSFCLSSSGHSADSVARGVAHSRLTMRSSAFI
jgi:hypothetical protein